MDDRTRFESDREIDELIAWIDLELEEAKRAKEEMSDAVDDLTSVLDDAKKRKRDLQQRIIDMSPEVTDRLWRMNDV